MSCEGPLLQVHPQHPPSPHYSAMTLDPRNSHLFRHRAASTSEQLLQVPDDSYPQSNSSPPSPTHLESSLPTSLLLPISNISRSSSLPRHIRGVSAEPAVETMSLSSVSKHDTKRPSSPRIFRRATVDTTMMHKEEFDVSMCVC